MKNLLFIPLLLLSLLASSPSWGQDLDKGIAAYDSRDYATALRELLPLAEQGYAKAQFQLGLVYNSMYSDETGNTEVYKNYKIAVKWFRFAAEQRHADAQFYLGVMYYNGYGVPQNYTIAVKWFSLAAEQGDAAAQFNLGIMYGTGYDLPEDDKAAEKWFRLAAEQGHADAQNSLGWMYFYGEGDVPKNYIYAYMWGQIAASNGNDGTLRYSAAEKMYQKDISTARTLAFECMAKDYKGC